MIFVLSAAFFWFLVSKALSPVAKLRDLDRLVRNDTLFARENAAICMHPDMGALVREKAYKEALLELSGSDSIQLVVDLSDSTVNLYIRGVRIHTTKPGSVRRDRFFNAMPLIQQVKVFSRPLEIRSQFATIVKEPVVVRNAPRDTLEAAMDAWMPDTLIQKPAFLILHAEYGLDLIMEQEVNARFPDRWKKFTFHVRIRRERIFGREYHPAITLKMPASDLRAIYRALPCHARVVIRL